MFEWDEENNAANRRKHGVSFEDILPIFERKETEGLVLEDRRRDYGEARLVLVRPFAGRFYHVTFTWREGRIRVISARAASGKEVREYGQRKHH